MASIGSLLRRLVRSGVAGAGASIADLALLTVLVQVFGLSPRAASIPALVTGGIVMFFGQKYIAFRAQGRSVARELLLFAVVQAGSLLLTGLLYDTVLSFLPQLVPYYVVVRLVSTNLVWLFYSFPLWHWVFRAPARPSGQASPS
jgi:putative flippase GtrA